MASSLNTTFHAPYGLDSPTDRGGALLIVNIIGFFPALLSVGLRLYISYHNSEKGIAVFKDDLMCYAALGFSMIEFGLVWGGITKGYGKLTNLISPEDLVDIQQIQYATDLFYIASLFCSRASVVFLFQRLQSANSQRIWAIFFAFLSSWALACFFITALKCDLTHPWIQYNVKCTNLLTRWQFIEITGIIIECAIFLMSIYMVYTVRMKLSSKGKVVILFGTRVIVVIFGALRIAYLPSYINSSNPTFTGIPASIYALVIVYCSLITATTPLLKSFIVKFMIVGAKPSVIITKEMYSITTRTINTESNGNDNKKTKNFRQKRKSRWRSDPERGVAQDATLDTFSGYEPWMPGMRDNSNSGKTKNTSSSDHASDRSLQVDRTNKTESNNAKNVEESNKP